jgi:hypothetical protein
MAIDPQILTQVAPGPGGPNLIELETPFYWSPLLSEVCSALEVKPAAKVLLSQAD